MCFVTKGKENVGGAEPTGRRDRGKQKTEIDVFSVFQLSLDTSPWGPTKYSPSDFQGNGMRSLSKLNMPKTHFISLHNDIGEMR